MLDEATAHLDSESEAAVQRALKTALAGRTSLVIAHRLSTIREADQILVVDAGRIIERGEHAGLLAAGGLYADLYRTQFARQEPACADAWRSGAVADRAQLRARHELDLADLRRAERAAPAAGLGAGLALAPGLADADAGHVGADEVRDRRPVGPDA